MHKLLVCALTLSAPASGFVAGRAKFKLTSSRLSNHRGSFDPIGVGKSEMDANPVELFAVEGGAAAAPSGLALSLPLLALAALPEDAMAKGGEYGIGEGRIVSLLHPAVMGVCFVVSLGAAYTGFQWRRIRELQGEVAELKAALKTPEAALAAISAEPTPAEAARADSLRAEVKALQADIDAKAATRKDLVGMDFRDRHWALGSLLLGLGTSFAIEGPVNTYMRAGKLFPGPHLYAGAGCVAMWALAAALVPQMQKGKDWARSGHIGLNVGATGLFVWQISTGLGIAAKVIEKTKFP